jgi:hypothetical protein
MVVAEVILVELECRKSAESCTLFLVVSGGKPFRVAHYSV